jgi:CO/xanthine dehydrogenase Mo-binding subunit
VNPTLDPHQSVVDPRETPKLGNAMSASMTAFHHLHAIEEACGVLYDYGILPAARAIWGESSANVRWEDGCLVAEGKEPLPLTRLVARAYQDGLAVGAMVHTYYQARFATAEFEVHGVRKRRFLDALAILWGLSVDYALLDRQNVVYPQGVSGYQRTLYASVGNLIGVEVHERSGEIRVREAVTFLDAGDPHHYALLAGQVEGGFAMGLGQALFEELPPGSGGVDGLWNLHRYQVCRANDMPLARFELVLVPLDSASVLSDAGTRPRIRKKGIAEAAMTTVAPALHNAVAHAAGLRINRLPMTPERVLEALTQQ